MKSFLAAMVVLAATVVLAPMILDETGFAASEKYSGPDVRLD
ncbi:hypothetical protein [Profundibacterium mesophilum]|uniref:Uncharacterized protein n=1 Tax=Profundibacterium mesophilum KAUST100406-0324 TaxID=1037889 RepID=A0A921TEJ4_9RHOB|nr:hypothetical protein [Profundibacterium mesophilum]KAF0677371.1 hypothetical protein PMES_00283 [Profundibacterium mesophilum KAUST100406-0324]